MSNLTSLLAAVREDGDDNALPVLADWLDDHGDPGRADLIRVQLELESQSKDGPRREELVRRVKDLRRRYEGVWLGPFFEVKGVEVTFRFGLLVVSMSAEGLYEASREVPIDAPEWDWAGRVELTLCNADKVLDLQCPLLPRVDSLILRERPSGGGYMGTRGGAHRHLRRLAKATTLTRLRGLDASDQNVEEDWVQLLARAAFADQLTNLVLRYHSPTSAGVRTLVEALTFRNLRHLDLASNWLDGQVQLLSGAPFINQLTNLVLRRTFLTSAGVSTLTEVLTSGNLRLLDLTGNNIRDQGAVALAAWPGLVGLNHLNLSRNMVGDSGALALMNALQPGKLSSFDLWWNRISPRVVRRLRQQFGDRINCDDQQIG